MSGFAKRHLNLFMFYKNELKFIPVLFNSLTLSRFYYVEQIKAVSKPIHLDLNQDHHADCIKLITAEWVLYYFYYYFLTLDWFCRSARTSGNQMEKGRKTDTALQHVIFCQPAAHTPNLTLWHSESQLIRLEYCKRFIHHTYVHFASAASTKLVSWSNELKENKNLSGSHLFLPRIISRRSCSPH